MDYLDVYKSRCGGTNGSSVNSVIQQSQQTYINLFKSNPSYQQIAFNGDLVDCIIMNTEKFVEKNLMFLPNQSLRIGNNVGFENYEWIITDFQTNKVYPFGKMQLCNDTLLIPVPDTQEPTGEYDDMGNPIYTTTSHPPAPFPCILTNINDAINNRSSSPVIITTGTIEITIGYSSDPNLQYITENTIFHIAGHEYKIYGIDYTDMISDVAGLIHIYANKSPDTDTTSGN